MMFNGQLLIFQCTSCLILIGILMINILENLRVLPPVTGVTFLPFVSTNPGDMIVSIGLLGIALWCRLNDYKGYNK